MLGTDNSANSLQSGLTSISSLARSPELLESQLLTAHTIAFIDTHITDATAVMANIQADVKILLDPTQDGISQITAALSHYQNLTGIEIVSHGSAAEIQLGKNSLTATSLSQYAPQIQQWHKSLAAGADILFYGCNVASGLSGQSLIEEIASLTGADIAASTNLTGNSAKGGDWNLEYTTGKIETDRPFSASFASTYQDVFASVFSTQVPTNLNQSDGTGSAGDYELGMEFTSAKAGQLNAIRYYKSPSETGSHIGRIWSNTGTLLGSVTFTNETASGWQQQALTTPLNITANTTYVVSVNANSYFTVTGNGLGTTITNGDLSAVADGSNGIFNTTPGAFPTFSNTNNNYFRDVVFTPTTQPPGNQLGTIALSGTATQNQTLTANVADADGLTGVTINYKWQQSNDNGTTWIDITGATNQTLTLGQAQTNNRVRATATYTDTLGNAENVLSPATSVISGSTILLESVFSNQVPGNINQSDGTGSAGDYELGMEFTSAKAGQLNAIRYYKSPSETGSHIGRIWSNTGTLLGSVTFTNETASGWQQQALTTPLNITANTTYVVSVNANSYFAVTGNGLGTTITNGNLSAVADGSNGIFNTTPGAFPTFSNTNNNYFRDVVFTPTTQPPGNQPGTISVSGTATQNQVLSANVADPDGLTGVTIAYKWQQSSNNGTTWIDISEATNKTLTLAQAQVNKLVRVRATYTDVLGSVENVLSLATIPIVNVNDVGKVILKGSATVGRTLTETVLDPDGLPGANIAYRWQQSTNGTTWTNITGATTKALALTNNLLGRQVRIRTTYTDALGTNENIFSAGAAITAQNAIVLENQKLGTSSWQIGDGELATNNEIAGFGDASSVNKGQALNLKVSLAQAGQYAVDVYRLGYYNGTGGRLITSATGLAGVTQAAATIDPTTRLVEYNWNNSYTLQTQTSWTSGLYLAKLTESATGKQSYVEFTVRDDGRPAELGFQEASSTVAAYNNYGGYSSYNFNSINNQGAYKVSFNRPIAYDTNGILAWEYQTARWMESQGYDISYYSNLDVHTNPLQLYSHNAFLSVGHDEYWSLEMRNNVETARDNGTNLAFFSANSAYWRVRFEPSTTTNQANRTLAIYKDNWALDPVAQQDNSKATTRFRSAQVNRPENALLGVMYTGSIEGTNAGFDFVVSNAADPYYANTGLANGDAIPGLVGYEWDAVVNNGLTPAGLVILSQSPVVPVDIDPDLPPNTNLNVSNAVRYTAASGAKVFATGSIQWVWGLDSDLAPPRRSPLIQKITTNVLADLGAQPRTPQIFPAAPLPAVAPGGNSSLGSAPKIRKPTFVRENVVKKFG